MGLHAECRINGIDWGRNVKCKWNHYQSIIGASRVLYKMVLILQLNSTYLQLCVMFSLNTSCKKKTANGCLHAAQARLAVVKEKDLNIQKALLKFHNTQVHKCCLQKQYSVKSKT